MIRNQASDVLFHAELRPNRSAGLSVANNVLIFLLVVFVPTAIGFTLAGAWPVFGFLGLELVLLYGALRLNLRSSRVVETIAVTRSRLTVHRRNPWGRDQSWSLQPQWLNVDADRRGRLELRSQGRILALGAFLTRAERVALADKLQRALAALAQPCRPTVPDTA